MPNRYVRSLLTLLSLNLLFPLSHLSLPILARAHDAPPQRADGMTVHVEPDGDDRFTGSIPARSADGRDGPLASLQGARDRIRRLRLQGDGSRPIKVLLGGGTYRVTGPVVFGPSDGGTHEAPVVYRAIEGSKPVIDGGIPLRGLKSDSSGLWTATFPEFAAGRRPIEQLFVNGRRARRARSPNSAYHHMLKSVTSGTDPETGQVVPMGSRAFVARPDDLEQLRGLTPAQLRDVNVVVYHAWEVSRHRIVGIDFPSGRVILTECSPWPFFNWGPDQRYHLENLKPALDEPGEWFLDRDGTLSYRPLPGEDLGQSTVVAPVAGAFLAIQGDPDARAWVRHLRFQGLTFRHSRYDLPERGHGDAQAAASIPAVILADGAQDVSLVDCRIEHTGIYAIWFRRGCTDCRVERCALKDLGAGGMRIGEAAIPSRPERTTGRITIHNSMIRGGGRIFPGAVGLWIGQSSDNTITHNDIADLFYTSISAGWTWGYGESACRNNTIEYNHLHHIGRGVLSDMGGVYTLGNSPGTSVSNNVIHDVDSFARSGAGGWGLYNDEGSTGIRQENNLVYNTTTGSYHQHYGRENVVRNNILAFSRNGQIVRSREEPHLSFTFERNIVIWDDGPLLSGTWHNGQFRLDRNLYWQTGGHSVTFDGRSLEDWRKTTGQDTHSTIADPQFVDASRRDFRLRPESPAFPLGFQIFDSSKAGVYGSKDWIAEASASLSTTIPVP